MIVNAANLEALRVGFKTSFQEGMGLAPPMWERVASLVPSARKEERYGWLGSLPQAREWVGPRKRHSLKEHDYSIVEKKWELTLDVDRDDIETDNLGSYSLRFKAFGESTRTKTDHLVFALLLAGFATPCYDGQYFFDTDHPVIDKDGNVQSVSNTGGGSGTPWFLLCTQSSLKPILHQQRKDFEFVAKDKVTDDNVFDENVFVYGADARSNVGYGFWQQAYGSKQTLNAANYAAGRQAIMSVTADHGNPIGLIPNLLVVPPSLESAGRKILNSEYGTGGETNEWKGTAELLVAPWLAVA